MNKGSFTHCDDTKIALVNDTIKYTHNNVKKINPNPATPFPFIFKGVDALTFVSVRSLL